MVYLSLKEDVPTDWLIDQQRPAQAPGPRNMKFGKNIPFKP